MDCDGVGGGCGVYGVGVSVFGVGCARGEAHCGGGFSGDSDQLLLNVRDGEDAADVCGVQALASGQWVQPTESCE